MGRVKLALIFVIILIGVGFFLGAKTGEIIKFTGNTASSFAVDESQKTGEDFLFGVSDVKIEDERIIFSYFLEDSISASHDVSIRAFVRDLDGNTISSNNDKVILGKNEKKSYFIDIPLDVEEKPESLRVEAFDGYTTHIIMADLLEVSYSPDDKEGKFFGVYLIIYFIGFFAFLWFLFYIFKKIHLSMKRGGNLKERRKGNLISIE